MESRHLSGQWQALLKVFLPALTGISLRISVVPFFPELMGKYAVNYAALGALQSSWAISFALLQIPAGIVADRVSSRFVLPIPFVLLATWAFLFAWAPNYAAVLAIRVLMGATAAFIFPSFTRFLTQAFPVRRGMAMGFYEGCVGAGFLTGLTVLPIIAIRIGLIPAFTLLGFLCLASAFISSRLAADDSQPRLLAKESAASATFERFKLIGADSPFAHLTIGRRLTGFILLSFLGALAVDSLLNWLSAYYRLGLGYGIKETASLMALTLISYILSAYIAGTLSDRLGRIAVMSTGSLVLVVCLVFLINAGHTIQLYGIAPLMGIGMAAAVAPMGAIASELFGANRAGRTTAILVIAAQAAQFTSSLVFGHFIDITGSFRIIWVTTIGCLLVRIAAGQILSLRPLPKALGIISRK